MKEWFIGTIRRQCIGMLAGIHSSFFCSTQLKFIREGWQAVYHNRALFPSWGPYLSSNFGRLCEGNTSCSSDEGNLNPKS